MKFYKKVIREISDEEAEFFLNLIFQGYHEEAQYFVFTNNDIPYYLKYELACNILSIAIDGMKSSHYKPYGKFEPESEKTVCERCFRKWGKNG